MMLWMRDQENLERGIKQGMYQGIRQQRRNTIVKMLRQGFSDEQIKSVCDSSEKEILECRAELMKK